MNLQKEFDVEIKATAHPEGNVTLLTNSASMAK